MVHMLLDPDQVPATVIGELMAARPAGAVRVLWDPRKDPDLLVAQMRAIEVETRRAAGLPDEVD